MKVIETYIKYLRNISRKIISRNGFENVLPVERKKGANFYFDLSSYKSHLSTSSSITIDRTNEQFYKYIFNVDRIIEDNKEIKLFIGLGLINGEYKLKGRNSILSSPVFYSVMDIEKGDNDFEYILSVDKESYQLNYDLLAKLLHIEVDYEYDLNNISLETIENFRLIEEIENEFLNVKNNVLDVNQNGILDYIEVFNRLKENVEECRDIFYSNNKFRYEERVSKINQVDTEYAKASFYDHIFLFLHKVPDQLSTYEALNKLSRLENVSNKLINKVFTNALTDNYIKFEKPGEISENEIYKIVEEKIPLSLSKKQIEAVSRAWTNEITYIEGPPGTGKSHTISAIILSAIFLNKKVLLVSQKKAALDVVKNMVDNILGEEAILYIGSKDKISTKKYLDNLLQIVTGNSSPLFNNDFQEIELKSNSFNEKLNEINNQIGDILETIKSDLELDNKYFKQYKDFIQKRNNFKDVYYPLAFDRYEFYNGGLDFKQYKSAIQKYKKIIDRESQRRIDVLYLIKFVNHFVERFNAERRLIRNNSQYAADIFSMNGSHVLSNEYLGIMDKERLFHLRKRLKSLEREKVILLKQYLPDYFTFRKLEKIFLDSSNNIVETINLFKGMLHFRNPSIISEKMNRINFNLLTDILPLWCSELRDLGNSFPLKNEIFDLVIVDEASQVNIAEIIPAFYRGKQFCIVGDDKQLHLNATGLGFALSKSFDKLVWMSEMNKLRNYSEKVISFDRAKEKSLIVSEASILNFIMSDANNFSIPKTELDEHYRSLPKLAKFNNDVFYSGSWKIMKENGENVKKKCFRAIKVNGERPATITKGGKSIKAKFVPQEIERAIGLIKEIIAAPDINSMDDFKDLGWHKDYIPSIGILSFLTLQRDKLRETLENEIPIDSIYKHNIFIATPEEFQGNERDIMIITLGLDGIGSWGKGFYEDDKRFNVATSRAKYFSYLIYAGIPPNSNLIKQYLNHFNVKINESDIIDTNVEAMSDEWKFDMSLCESEFEEKVAYYLLEYIKGKPNLALYNQVTACGQKRLDFVVFNQSNNITCAIEVDGKDHFENNGLSYTEAHLTRQAILERADWKIVNVKYYNWYSNGWLCESGVKYFDYEIERLYNELNRNLKLA